jgi:hypothetical protein
MIKYILSSSLACMTLLVTGVQERDAFAGMQKLVSPLATHTHNLSKYSDSLKLTRTPCSSAKQSAAHQASENL